MNAGGLGTGLHAAPIPVTLWVRDGDGFRITDVNDAGCAFLNRPRAQIVGATPRDFGGDHARGKRDMLRAAGSGNTVRREIPYFRESGDVLQLEVIYVGLGDDALLTFVRDVTPQRQAEHRLRLTEDRYRTLIGAANEGVWLVDPSGGTTFANGKVGRILGRPLAEIAEKNLLDFVEEPDRAAV